MAITVVGSVAYDSIETPAGRRERCLGGAATYFSLAASFFTDVRVIAVVGEDFRAEQEAVFNARKIDTRGIERAAGKSFFWEGSYLDNLNEAKTHATELNVFAAFAPKIPEAYRDSEFLFLANIDPVLQRRVREQMPDVKLVAGDTMNYWIKDHRPALHGSAEGARYSAHQRHGNQHAGRQQQSGAGSARGAGAGAAYADRQAWRVWSDGFFQFPQLCCNRMRARNTRSGRRRCRWKKWSIPLARATALPADSSATWPHNANSLRALFDEPCFTAA